MRATSTIAGNADPYRWAFGQVGTVESGNTALGRPAPLCEGPGIPMPPFIFVEALAVQPPDAPPVPRPPGGTPVLGALDPCPRSTGLDDPPGPAPVLTPTLAAPASPVRAAARFTKAGGHARRCLPRRETGARLTEIKAI